MSDTYLFLASATILTLGVLAWLMWPLLRPGNSGKDSPASRRALNAAIYRDQLAELERDRVAGILSEADYQQARNELQHRLLADAGDASAGVSAATTHTALPPARRSALLVALLLPLAAAGLYLWLGNPATLGTSGARHEISAEQIDAMVAKLAERMKQNPDDLQGWIMLARSTKALRRLDEAAEAYRNVMRLGGEKNPDLLADYADLLAVRAGGNLEGEPLKLVQQALSLDPDHVTALALAGSAAYTRSDHAAALDYWGRLLKLLPAESDEARSLSTALDEIRKRQAATKEATTPSAH
jgi:cytochrome c-type biogenesis protein CcmH